MLQKPPAQLQLKQPFIGCCFLQKSPDTPWPSDPGEYTAFKIEYATGGAIDLLAPPPNQYRIDWMHLTSYDACQQLADACRQQNVDIIKYQSVRDQTPSANFTQFTLPRVCQHNASRQTNLENPAGRQWSAHYLRISAFGF